MSEQEARLNRTLAAVCVLFLTGALVAYVGLVVAAVGLTMAFGGWTIATADSYIPRKDTDA